MLKINGVAKGQYKQLCPISWDKCNNSEHMLEYKIRRCVDLGTETYSGYNNGCKIIRYGMMNFLVSQTEVMTMWMDKTRFYVEVSEKQKLIHRQLVRDRILPFATIEKLLKNNFYDF